MIDHKSQNRPTIGFLTANIHIGASRVLWPGILEAAVSGNANLICFPGGRLHAAEEVEARRNVIYQQVDTGKLAGLVIWTSALAGAATSQEVVDFHQAYHTVPIVDLAASTGYGPTVTIDGNQGMHALLVHLIEEHGYQRIALIRGPESHPYASERHRAFAETLQEKGLPLDERLISPALGWNKGAEAMSVLLDERELQPGRDFQAVVAASDLLAIGAIRLMAARGIHVPRDVAVAGFNDIEEGRLVRPPLTSVSLPFYEQGWRSVTTLLAVLDGQTAPNEITMESRLLVRQSCGCPSWSEKLAMAGLTAVSPAPPANSQTHSGTAGSRNFPRHSQQRDCRHLGQAVTGRVSQRNKWDRSRPFPHHIRWHVAARYAGWRRNLSLAKHGFYSTLRTAADVAREPARSGRSTLWSGQGIDWRRSAAGPNRPPDPGRTAKQRPA